MKGVEDIQTAEPKLILKRSPKEVSKLDQVHVHGVELYVYPEDLVKN